MENSAIKAWLDGDRLQPWHVALDKDLEATKNVFAMLGADLSAITRRKVVVGFDFKPMIDQMMLRTFNSIEDRMQEALSIFTTQFGAEIAKISSKIKALQACEVASKEVYDCVATWSPINHVAHQKVEEPIFTVNGSLPTSIKSAKRNSDGDTQEDR